MQNLIDEYTKNEWEIIHKEFDRIKDNHYLDHAGTTLYSAQQIHNVADTLSSNIYCNPHTSKSTEDLIDQVRYKILQHFNTTTNEFSVVFTSGTTASLKLIGETFDFQTDTGQFVHVKDVHTSVLGMREIVQTKTINCIETKKLLQAINEPETLVNHSANESTASNSLLVFPAQCNFNGFKYPLELIQFVQTNGLPGSYSNSKWFVCLDAAAFVSTNFLDLTKYQPDFVCLSFYKLFGYPTGLGALLVSKRGQSVLKKQYYGGGTVKIAMTGKNWHEKRDCFHERFEDGTLPFLSIISLLSGYQILDRLIPPNDTHSTIQRISRHCFNLAQYLHESLKNLRHSNGNHVVNLYHDTDFSQIEKQGAIVNFNLLHNDGNFVGFAEVSCMASIYNIILRTGCFCNPGACQRLLQLSDADVETHYKAGHICGDSNDLINGIPTGSIRISIGYMTTKSNVDALLKMITECYIRNVKPITFHPDNIQRFYKMTMKSTMAQTKCQLKQICVYPIKSCGALKITTKWPITRRGLKYDREWMIVNANGVAVTQKIDTKLCLIMPTIDEENNWLTLSFPYMKSIRIPLVLNDQQKENSEMQATLCQSKVCGDRVEGIDCGNEVAEWLSDALYTSGLRLIRQCSNDERKFKKNGDKDTTIALTNQAQYLLINKTSVKWLTDKVTDWHDSPLSIDNPGPLLEGVVDRFRGNLIIESDNILEELEWKSLAIGKHNFCVDGICMRCQMICIDQRTGEKTTEPLRTIAREFRGKMRFGIYLSIDTLLSDNENFISCSDEITIKL